MARQTVLALLLLFPLIAACGPAAASSTPAPTVTIRPYGTETATPMHTALPTVDSTPDSLIPSPTPFVHELQAGETLLDLVLRYGVTLEGLLTVNPGIDPRFLSIGQAIRIPDPEGAPVDSLLPTSTPVPLDLSRAACYPTLTQAIWCVATIENDTNSDLEGLTAEVRLLDDRGEIVDRALATSPLSRLPAGSIQPMAVLFDPSQSFAGAEFELLSAIASSGSERYLETSLTDIQRIAGSAGEWTVSGVIDFELSEESPEPFRISLVAMGVDADGSVVGFTKWEPEADADQPFEFELTVYTLGPQIDMVELLVEAAVEAE